MINREGFLESVEEKDVALLKNDPQEFWNGVIWIGELAFRDLDNLTSITIPDGIKIIGDFAFLGCENLTSITIPKSVVYMDYGTFLGCDKLEKVILKDKNNLPDGLKSVFMGFYFDSFEINGDEVTFVRNVEKQEENE